PLVTGYHNVPSPINLNETTTIIACAWRGMGPLFIHVAGLIETDGQHVEICAVPCISGSHHGRPSGCKGQNPIVPPCASCVIYDLHRGVCWAAAGVGILENHPVIVAAKGLA